MTATESRARRLLSVGVAALLMLGTVLLVLGVSLEHATEQDLSSSSASESTEHQHDEQAERTERGDSNEHTPLPTVAGSRESPLKAIAESPAALAALVLITLGLAAVVWRRPTRPVVAVVALFALGAVVFDIAEISHHLAAQHTGLAALAGLITATRIAVIVGAAQLWRTD